MAEPHSSPIKTPQQLVAVVAVAFVAPIVVIALLAALVTSGTKGGSSDPKIVAERIKPVGTLVVEEQPIPASPTTATPPQAKPAAPIVAATIPPPAAPAAAGAKADGKSVYDTACAACHAAGIAGAPKHGDKGAWAPRLAAGKDAMYAAALKGKGAMPPKGGQLQLSDEQVRSAVDFMTAAAK